MPAIRFAHVPTKGGLRRYLPACPSMHELARAGLHTLIVIAGVALFGVGTASTIGRFSAVVGGGSIATETAPVTVTAQPLGGTAQPLNHTVLPLNSTVQPLNSTVQPSTGADWLLPGGPAVQLPVAVRNPGDVAFAVHTLLPDGAAFPSRCPLSAWSVRSTGGLPTLPARSAGTVTLEISLRSQAPDSCQGTTVSFGLTVVGVPA